MILRSLPEGYKWVVRPTWDDGHIVQIRIQHGWRWLPRWTWWDIVESEQIDTHGMLPAEFEARVDDLTYKMAGNMFRKLNVRGWCKQLVY